MKIVTSLTVVVSSILASSTLFAADSVAGLTRQLSGHIPVAIQSEGMKDAGKLDEAKVSTLWV